MQIAPKFSNLNYKHLQAYLTLWHFKNSATGGGSISKFIHKAIDFRFFLMVGQRLQFPVMQVLPQVSYLWMTFHYLSSLSLDLSFPFLGCAGSLLLHAGFLQLPQARATLSCSLCASHCGGFSCGAWTQAHRLQWLWHLGSIAAFRAQLLCGMWDLSSLTRD